MDTTTFLSPVADVLTTIVQWLSAPFVGLVEKYAANACEDAVHDVIFQAISTWIHASLWA